MKTVNISITEDQAQFVDKTTKTYGFANRSEFLRAVLRFVHKTNPELLKQISEAPFAPTVAKPLLTLDEIRKIAIPILQKHDVEFAGVFGSYARGEAKPESDVDIVIRYRDDNKKSLLDIIGLQNDLAAAIGAKIDLGTEDSIHPYIKESVKKDLKVLYGQGPRL